MVDSDRLINLDDLLSDAPRDVEVGPGKFMRLLVPSDLLVLARLRRLRREEILAYVEAFKDRKDQDGRQEAIDEPGTREELIVHEFKVCAAALVACLDPEHGVTSDAKAVRLIQHLGGTDHELVATALELSGLGGREADENPTKSQSQAESPSKQ